LKLEAVMDIYENQMFTEAEARKFEEVKNSCKLIIEVKSQVKNIQHFSDLSKVDEETNGSIAKDFQVSGGGDMKRKKESLSMKHFFKKKRFTCNQHC
jgi:hypothetical protein